MCRRALSGNPRRYDAASTVTLEITFVRHGQTEWNATKRFQGQSDIPLSEVGRTQARAAAEALAFVPFTHVYSSDLARAAETARTIARPHGLDVVSDVRLREFDFGQWEGLTWVQIVERWPELGDHSYTQARLYHPIGGETFEAVVTRASAFLSDIAGLTDANILVVTHAGALHALIEALGPNLRGRPSEPIVFTTGSITRVAMEPDGPRLITLDNVDHLHPSP